MDSIKKQFTYYKKLGDLAFAQLSTNDIFIRSNNETNDIATLVKHLHGNMLSR